MLQDTALKEKSKLRVDTLRIVTNNLKKYRQEALLIRNKLNDPEQLANGCVWVVDPSFWRLKDDLLNNHAVSLLASDVMLQSPILNCDLILQKYIGEHGIDTWLRTESLVDNFTQTM